MDGRWGFEEETNKRERDGHPLSRIADTHRSFSYEKVKAKDPNMAKTRAVSAV